MLLTTRIDDSMLPLDRWLDAGQDDGKTERQLVPVEQPPPASPVQPSPEPTSDGTNWYMDVTYDRKCLLLNIL